MNWFESKYNNLDLADVLSDYHKDVHGFRLRMDGESRLTLVRELENLDRYVAAHDSREFA